MRKRWTISIGHTEAESLGIYSAEGSTSDIKKILVKLVKEAKMQDRYEFYSGASKISEIKEERDGTLNAVAVFEDYRIVFTATPLTSVYDVSVFLEGLQHARAV